MATVNDYTGLIAAGAAFATAIAALVNSVRGNATADANACRLDKQADHLLSHDAQLTTIALATPPPVVKVVTAPLAVPRPAQPPSPGLPFTTSLGPSARPPATTGRHLPPP